MEPTAPEKNPQAERKFIYIPEDVDAFRIISTGLPDKIVEKARKQVPPKGTA